jgi:hypothetical protein
MTTRSTQDRLVDDYLDQLSQELATAPASTRRDLTEEITAHIAEARSALADGGTEAEVRTLLDRLGDPAEISSGLIDEPESPRKAGRGWVEGLALVLLPVGGLIVPFAGWLVGVVLLWVSQVWTTTDKLLGTLVLPFGLLPAFLYVGVVGVQSGQSCSSVSGGPTTCTGGASTLETVAFLLLLAVLVIAPIAMAIRLGRRLAQGPTTAAD